MMSSVDYWCSSVLLESGWADDVWISVADDGRIISTLPNTSADKLPEGTQRLNGTVVCGVPNLHSHAHQRAMAGLGEKASGSNDSFWTWRKAMYQMLERLEPDQLFAIARMLYLEMLAAGYTHVAEFQYLHHDPAGRAYTNRAEMTLQCARAAADVGIGFTALPVLYRNGGFGGAEASDGQKRFLNDAEGFLEIVSQLQTGLASGQALGIAPHSLRAVDQTLLGEVLRQVPTDMPVHLHIAEQLREVEECLAFSDRRPVEWLYHHFEPDPRWCLIHATHVTEAEVVSIAESGAVAGLCPATEANLGDGIFPAMDFLARGGVFGIGSDSHISVSPVEELRWLEYGQRLMTHRRNVLTDDHLPHSGTSLLSRAVTGGASVCGAPVGSISEGNRADLLVLDSSHPRLYGRDRDELVDSWVFSGNDNVVQDVIVGGRMVIAGGQHPQQSAIQAGFRQTIDQLTQ